MEFGPKPEISTQALSSERRVSRIGIIEERLSRMTDIPAIGQSADFYIIRARVAEERKVKNQLRGEMSLPPKPVSHGRLEIIDDRICVLDTFFKQTFGKEYEKKLKGFKRKWKIKRKINNIEFAMKKAMLGKKAPLFPRSGRLEFMELHIQLLENFTAQKYKQINSPHK